MSSIPTLDPPLADRHVSLRDVAERDIPEILIAHQDDPELYVRIGLERPPSAAELGRQAEEEATLRATGAGARLAILEHHANELRGLVTVQDLDWANAVGELGIWVIPQARGRGLARAALRLASRWLFESCGLERVQLIIGPDNEPMLQAAQAAGFQQEALLRSYTRERGQRWDVKMLSLLPGDL
jgi:ribosomal-protein-alanine N-acetyltransferase